MFYNVENMQRLLKKIGGNANKRSPIWNILNNSKTWKFEHLSQKEIAVLKEADLS